MESFRGGRTGFEVAVVEQPQTHRDESDGVDGHDDAVVAGGLGVLGGVAADVGGGTFVEVWALHLSRLASPPTPLSLPSTTTAAALAGTIDREEAIRLVYRMSVAAIRAFLD